MRVIELLDGVVNFFAPDKMLHLRKAGEEKPKVTFFRVAGEFLFFAVPFALTALIMYYLIVVLGW